MFSWRVTLRSSPAMNCSAMYGLAQGDIHQQPVVSDGWAKLHTDDDKGEPLEAAGNVAGHRVRRLEINAGGHNPPFSC